MKSQWECVLENLGEWVGSFTTVTPQAELIEDIPSVIKLAGMRDNQAVHLVLNRFYPLPNSTEKYAKEVVWDFSTPPGIGAIYFETGAFSSGALVVNIGVKTIAEFSLIAGDRRFRMIQTFDIAQQLDRVTFVREQLQGATTPERPHLNITDLLGTWTGIATTSYADQRTLIETNTRSTFSVSDTGYQLVEQDHLIDLTVTTDLLSARLWQFTDERDHQSYQLLLLPDGGYAITPTKINLGNAFYLEIGWIPQTGQRQRLVRRYDSSGKWESVTLIVEKIIDN
ncbi:MAG: DUF3598 family protein [Chamaesiphon sp.]|nr:DUF3598 family protein [Chamaesiphon sp.]